MIESAATRSGLSAPLVAALCRAETAGDSWRARYEAQWSYFTRPDDFAKKLGISFATEHQFQMTSWGLLQLMGGRARELGFTDHLQKLSIPEVGLAWGCASLQKMAEKYASRDDLIAAHNAGSARRNPDGTYVNQPYVDRVLGFLKALGA